MPEQLASLIVERYNLKPPVDIEQLLAEFATIEMHAWPQKDCDGFALLSEAPPRVFIRRNSPPRRRRFTMGHELGHVVCFSHRGERHCQLHSSPQVFEEAQASSFASHVLLPTEFLRPFQEAYASVPEILDAISIADVSAQAGILALRRVLLPGYVFSVPGLEHLVTSVGTALPEDLDDLPRLAKASGAHKHQGVEIHWYQMGEGTAVTLRPQSAFREPMSVMSQCDRMDL